MWFCDFALFVEMLMEMEMVKCFFLYFCLFFVFVFSQSLDLQIYLKN